MQMRPMPRPAYVDQYAADGYVIIRGLLDVQEDLAPVVAEYDALVDTLACDWLAQGLIAGYDPEAPLAERLVTLMRESDGACYQPLDISLPLTGVIQENTPMHHGQAVFDLIRNPKLLDAVEQFIGPEIYSNPVQHMRIKAPERYISEQVREAHTLIGRTFWHQDLGVIAPEADNSNVLSVWIPIIDTDEENGCLVVARGSHRKGLVHHCRTSLRNGIAEDRVEGERTPLPMKAGDVLFLNKCTMHASLPNRCDRLRWSVDLRYNPIDDPTGRPWFPGFVCRSRRNPEAELDDASAWATLWRDARSAMADRVLPQFNRWNPGDPLCA